MKTDSTEFVSQEDTGALFVGVMVAAICGLACFTGPARFE